MMHKYRQVAATVREFGSRNRFLNYISRSHNRTLKQPNGEFEASSSPNHVVISNTASQRNHKSRKLPKSGPFDLRTAEKPDRQLVAKEWRSMTDSNPRSGCSHLAFEMSAGFSLDRLEAASDEKSAPKMLGLQCT
jgi:hypothetical protein